MTQIEAMKQALEALKNNKLTHLYCEDTWYSCPKHEDGCANEAEGDECNCGADDVNAQFDQAITALEEALAQTQEPVHNVQSNGRHSPLLTHMMNKQTTPPQRKPLTNGEIYTAYITATNQTLRAQDEQLAFAFARAIEAAHGIKENT